LLFVINSVSNEG